MLAALGQLANGNMDAALADFADPIGNNVGFTSIGVFAMLADLESVFSRIQDALQSAETADVDFIAGLPGLLS